MRNKILYLYTEDLNFFYKLNKELIKRNVHFKILSGISKIPDFRAILLTTYKDVHNLQGNYKKLKFMVYDEKNNFNHYIYKVLAAYRIDYKDFYSDLNFSIDPGSKKVGMVVFLDDYYLNSHTFYDSRDIVNSVKEYVNCFQIENPNSLKLTFKFGSGVLPMTLNLIEEISDLFQERNNLKVLLVNESKSSKVKIQNLKKKFKTKHELSALILALREGVEVTHKNNLETYKKVKKQDYNFELRNNGNNKNSYISFQDLIDRILRNEISLSESSEMLQKNTK